MAEPAADAAAAAFDDLLKLFTEIEDRAAREPGASVGICRASIITYTIYTILGAPYYKCSIMAPRPYSNR